MLKSLKDLKKNKIEMKNGDEKPIKDFLTDDVNMTVRYIVVDGEDWLPGRSVLVSTQTVGKPTANYELPVNLTLDQIKNGPILEKDKPIDRQYETNLFGYYGWKPYWSTEGKTQNLISMDEVVSYRVAALDGEIGHAEDLIVEDSDWTIRYLVVDTSNWNPMAKKTLISTNWIKDVNMRTKMINVDVSRDMVKNSPEYNSSDMLNLEAETKLYAHYKKSGQWIKKELEPQRPRV